VFDEDVYDSHPDWVENPRVAGKLIRIGPVARCRTDPQFLLLPEPFGRFTFRGARYDVFLKCDPDPRELGLDGYDARERDFVIDGGP
jgi:hypothetical protein